MRASGKIGFGTLLLLAVVGAIVYVGVLIVPFHVDHLDVKEAVAVAHNLSRTQKNDGVLRQEIKERTSRLGQHWEIDDFNRDVLKPGLGLTDEQILIERSEVNEAVRIEVRYERRVLLKPTSRTWILKFSAVKEGLPPL